MSLGSSGLLNPKKAQRFSRGFDAILIVATGARTIPFPPPVAKEPLETPRLQNPRQIYGVCLKTEQSRIGMEGQRDVKMGLGLKLQPFCAIEPAIFGRFQCWPFPSPTTHPLLEGWRFTALMKGADCPNVLFDPPPPPYMREIGTMWQIGVLTGKPCTFLGPKWVIFGVLALQK